MSQDDINTYSNLIKSHVHIKMFHGGKRQTIKGTTFIPENVICKILGSPHIKPNTMPQ